MEIQTQLNMLDKCIVNGRYISLIPDFEEEEFMLRCWQRAKEDNSSMLNDYPWGNDSEVIEGLVHRLKALAIILKNMTNHVTRKKKPLL